MSRRWSIRHKCIEEVFRGKTAPEMRDWDCGKNMSLSDSRETPCIRSPEQEPDLGKYIKCLQGHERLSGIEYPNPDRTDTTFKDKEKKRLLDVTRFYVSVTRFKEFIVLPL